MSSILRLKLLCPRNDAKHTFGIKTWFSEFFDLEHSADASSSTVQCRFHHTIYWKVVCRECNTWDTKHIRLPTGWVADRETVTTHVDGIPDCESCRKKAAGEDSDEEDDIEKQLASTSDPYVRADLIARYYGD